MKYFFYSVSISIYLFISGCNSVNQTLPPINEVKKISSFLISKKDNYNGILSSKSDDPIKTILDQNKINSFYSLIKNNYQNWGQFTINPPENLDYIIILYNSKSQILALWLYEDKIMILNKPIDPRNLSIIYKPGEKTVQELKTFLGL